MLVLAGPDLDDAPEAADSGVLEPDAGPRVADPGAEPAPGALARLPDSAERVEDYAGRSKSEATIRPTPPAGAISLTSVSHAA